MAQHVPMWPGPGVNTKTPPSWNPSIDSNYSYSDWKQDVLLWAEATEAQDRQKAPLIVLSLGGLARELAREVPSDQLRDGARLDFNDGQGPTWKSGIELFLNGLDKKFEPFKIDDELSIVQKKTRREHR